METISALLAICVGNSPVTVNIPHKGQRRGALMFSLICAWINGWVNNGDAGDLRHNRAHYDVTVMRMATGLLASMFLHQLVHVKCRWSVTASKAWWRQQMETFSALLALCEGNPPVTGVFPSQRPVAQSFDIFFVMRLNKRLNKQSRR